MKILKRVLLGIAILVAIPLIIALFVKKEYNVQREITINKPRAEVFDYVRHLRNQEQYSKWVMTDPAMQKSFRGTDGNVGFVYAWNGNSEAGEGEQEIKGLKEGEALEVEVRFKRPMEGIMQAPMYTEALSPTATKIKWGVSGRSPYPMNFMNLFMDRMLGKDLETSLHTLKAILEK